MTSLHRASFLLVLVAACGGGTSVVSQALVAEDAGAPVPATATAPAEVAERGAAAAKHDADDAGPDAAVDSVADAADPTEDAGHDAGFCGFDYPYGFTKQTVPAHMGIHISGGSCVYGTPDCATRTLCGCFNQVNTGDIPSSSFWTSNPYPGASFERTLFDPSVELPGCN